MRELPSRAVRHRVKGRQALEKRIRSVLLAVHRFGRCRAVTDEERRWARFVIDELTQILAKQTRP